MLRGGRRFSSIPLIWLTAIAFVAFLVMALGYAKIKLEQRVREQIVTVNQLAADRVTMTFDAADRRLLAIIDEVGADGKAGPVHASSGTSTSLRALLVREKSRDPHILSLAVAGTNGAILASSNSDEKQTSFADQPFFRDLLHQASARPALTPATKDPSSGIRSVQLIRRIDDADGRTTGFAIARIELENSLLSFCQSLAFSGRDLIALRDTGNGLLAGYPADKDPFVGSDGESMVRSAIAAGEFAGVGYLRSSVDGINRLVAYRKLTRYPVYMVFGKDVEDLLAMWRYEMAMVVLAALLAIVVSAAVTAGIRRRNVLTRQLETVRGHLVDSNNALRAALAASEMVAARDQLTGLWNRRAFDQRLQEVLAHLDRHDGTFSLLLLDLDHFKHINDQYGHVVGDEVLRRFADVLHERLRQNDIDARWGGEEFVVLADGARLEAAYALAEHIRTAVENTAFTGPSRVTVSIGVAEYRPDETGDSLLARADDALYEAKRTGRNCVVAASGLTHGERFFSGSAASTPLFAEEFA
jgi:diguanylate cyclase (GGDEF)-like protein